MFKSALAIYERLVKDNPEAYVSSLADIQLNLGILYLQTKRYPDSETMLKSALHNYEQCTEKTPRYLNII